MKLNVTVIKNFKYIFELVDDPHGVVAECQVYPISSLFCPEIRYFMITDVFVPPQFRGNEYTVALLMNVMERLGRKFVPEKIPPFRIASLRDNESALRCYRKVFGEPYLKTGKFVYFSSDPRDRKQKRWFGERIWEWCVN